MNDPLAIMLEALNQRFACKSNGSEIRFTSAASGMPLVHIKNPQAQALIALQGAHLLSWIPDAEEDVIWLSADANLLPGKSIRGGIPVCWPWFGAHENHESYPAHGFARTVLWQLADVKFLSTGETRLDFELNSADLSDDYKAMWPDDFALKYRLIIGRELRLELLTENHDQQAFKISQALHSYFNVGDIRKVRLFGLEDKPYLDKPDGFKRKTQQGPVIFCEEVDRIYLQTENDVVIDNGKRKIIISKQGSASTVVWNPWQRVADKMGDLGQDGYLKMLCVESANAAEDAVVIEAGEQHCLQVKYCVERGL